MKKEKNKYTTATYWNYTVQIVTLPGHLYLFYFINFLLSLTEFLTWNIFDSVELKHIK